MSISIGKRILLGFVAVTLVILALGIYALGQIGAVRDTTDAIVTRDLTVARKLDDLGNRARDMGILRRNAVIAGISGKRPAADQEDPVAGLAPGRHGDRDHPGDALAHDR